MMYSAVMTLWKKYPTWWSGILQRKKKIPDLSRCLCCSNTISAPSFWLNNMYKKTLVFTL